MLEEQVLKGVGKALSASYRAKKVTEKEVLAIFMRNKKESDAYDLFGLTIFDLIQEERRTHNPLLREKLNKAILQYNEKSRYSRVQNALNLEKLEHYRNSALGIGVRSVMTALRKYAKAGNIEAQICLKLMEIEFANLSAKKTLNKKKEIYERKDILLKEVSDLLYDNNWTCGISSNTGKNASYIVYVFLPNGTQLSWHTNEYSMLYYYDDIDCEWDGLPCSTMEKLLTYAHEAFGIGKRLDFFEANNAA